MKNILDELKKEIPYKWRVQSAKYGKATCVAYIDARDVMDLLDQVVGADNWQDDYKEIKGNVYWGIGINVEGTTVWKWDCGTQSNMEAEKGESSDAFKRAAVKWGIGRFLYRMAVKTFPTAIYPKNNKEYPSAKKDDPSSIIWDVNKHCLLYTSPSPRDATLSRMPSSA